MCHTKKNKAALRKAGLYIFSIFLFFTVPLSTDSITWQEGSNLGWLQADFYLIHEAYQVREITSIEINQCENPQCNESFPIDIGRNSHITCLQNKCEIKISSWEEGLYTITMDFDGIKKTSKPFFFDHSHTKFDIYIKNSDISVENTTPFFKRSSFIYPFIISLMIIFSIMLETLFLIFYFLIKKQKNIKSLLSSVIIANLFSFVPYIILFSLGFLLEKMPVLWLIIIVESLLYLFKLNVIWILNKTIISLSQIAMAYFVAHFLSLFILRIFWYGQIFVI